MDATTYPVQIRWSDLDPNFHLRHSVYYDWGAYCRILFLNTHSLTADVMQQLHIGPIIFREECVFKKEIRLEDEITIDLQLTKSRKDFSRWSVRHHIVKKQGDCISHPNTRYGLVRYFGTKTSDSAPKGLQCNRSYAET